MSEYFAGVTFPDQSVTPSDDAIFHRAVLPDGILTGCLLSYSGTTLSMGVGYLLICGRIVKHVASQSWPVVDAASGYARLVLTVDLSRASTKDAFDQVYPSLEYATSVDGFPSLDSGDINGTGTRYQMEACVVALGTGGVTGIVRSMPTLSGSGVFAPAGFGVGQDTPAVVRSLAELDSLTKTGVFRTELPLSDSFIEKCGDARFASVDVKAFDERTTLQTLYPQGTTSKIQRWRISGSWQAWRVSEPLMDLGAEYRTCDNWEGQPVYTQRIAYTADSFTAEAVQLPHGISNLGIVISADVIFKRTNVAGDGWRQLPQSDPSTGAADGHLEYVTPTSLCFRVGNTVRKYMSTSTEPVYVTLRYTKQ